MFRWLRQTLTRKFTILLAGFLALQMLQLGIGIFGILHVGEESSVINGAGKQRMRVYHALYLMHEALEFHSWSTEGRKSLDGIIADYDAESDYLSSLTDAAARHGRYTETVAVAREHWRKELKPLLLAFDPSVPRAATTTLAIFEAHVPAHIRHLDETVTLLEQNIAGDTYKLAVFQSLIISLTLILGLAGFSMAHYIVTLPLRRLTEATHSIAGGAFNKRVTVQSQDEIGIMGETFNRMAEAIGEKTARIAALNDIAVRLTSVQSLRELLNEIMRRGIQLSGAQAASIAFYDEETRRFGEWLTDGLSDEFVRRLNFAVGGINEHVFMSGTFVLSSDRPEAAFRLGNQDRKEGIRCFITIPLTSHASRLGVLNFYQQDRDFFLPDEIEILKTFSHLAAGAIENARLYEKTQYLAVTDKLTGLRNRRMFDQRLAEELDYAAQQARSLALLMIDIDDFKKINDTHGHVAGDKVLQALGHVLSGQLWKVDFASRYGGEEFSVILPQTNGSAASNVAERIRRSIAGMTVPLPDGRKIGVTVSIGIACFPECGETAESLIEHADQALYTAKREGKNRTCLYHDILKSQLEQNPGLIVDLLNQGLHNIKPIMTAVSAKTSYYHEHAAIVERIAGLAAKALNLAPEDRETLFYSAQLHDVGMISVPDSILAKQEALTGEDWELIRRHPAIAAGFLEQVPVLRRAAPVVRHHHERYDGKGYPDGLQGEEIPYLARVLTVVDAYASMLGEWDGHKALSPAKAGARLMAAAGTHFDPQIVSILVRALDGEHPPAREAAPA